MFLSPRAGRGNTCSVAAAFKKGEDDNGSLTVCLQNMGKESKVRMFDINNRKVHVLSLYVHCTGLNKVSFLLFYLLCLFLGVG